MSDLKPIDLNEIELFAAQYLSHLLTERVSSVHRQLCSILSDRSYKRIAIEVFRGAGKTTWANKIYTLYEICNGPYDDIQSISASAGSTGLSSKVMRGIRKELEENQLLKADFGISKGSSWGTEYIQVRRGDGKVIDVYCRGKGGAIRGSRGLVIIDDPQDFSDCQSATILNTDHYWFHDDVLPVLTKDQRCVFIGTSISPISLLSTVKRKAGWKVVEFCVDEPVGSFKSVWPEMFPETFLRQQFDDMGADSFNAEYRCRPLVSGNPVIKQDWLKYYTPAGERFTNVMKGDTFTVIAADTAISKKRTSDNTAIVVITAPLDQKPDFFVRECLDGKFSSEQFAMNICMLQNKYKANLVWVECSCNPPDKDGYVEAVENQARIQSLPLNLQWAHPTMSKLHRAYGVQGVVQSGRVFFNNDDPGQQMLINDLLVFVGDDNFPDDRVDAFVHGLTQFKEWGGRGKKDNKPIIVRAKHRYETLRRAI